MFEWAVLSVICKVNWVVLFVICNQNWVLLFVICNVNWAILFMIYDGNDFLYEQKQHKQCLYRLVYVHICWLQTTTLGLTALKSAHMINETIISTSVHTYMLVIDYHCICTTHLAKT